MSKFLEQGDVFSLKNQFLGHSYDGKWHITDKGDHREPLSKMLPQDVHEAVVTRHCIEYTEALGRDMPGLKNTLFARAANPDGTYNPDGQVIIAEQHSDWTGSKENSGGLEKTGEMELVFVRK